FVMGNTPVVVQFTSAGCLNYPCRTPLEVWKTLARLSARRRPASYGRGITLSRARQNEVRAPQPEGGTNDERHRSRRQGRVGPVEAGRRDLGGLESSRLCAARRSHNSHAQRAFQAR